MCVCANLITFKIDASTQKRERAREKFESLLDADFQVQSSIAHCLGIFSTRLVSSRLARTIARSSANFLTGERLIAQ